MILKGIGATTELDRHNCRMSKETLENTAKDIVENVYAIGVGIEHDSTIMPIGKVINGKMFNLENGEYALEIEQEIFDKYQRYKDQTGKIWYITESSHDRRPFADTQPENVSRIKVSIDPVNFSDSDFSDLMEFYTKECQLDADCFVRKSLIPDPEIVFTVLKGTIAVMAGKKIVEKLSDQVADDAVKIYELIKKVVLETIKRCTQKNKPVAYVLKEHGPYLKELVVVTDRPEILLEAVCTERISQAQAEIEKFEKTFAVDIAKLQCTYDIEKQKWEINFVSTGTGMVIGSEKCYKKTVELARKVEGGVSIAANANIDIRDIENSEA